MAVAEPGCEEEQLLAVLTVPVEKECPAVALGLHTSLHLGRGLGVGGRVRGHAAHYLSGNRMASSSVGFGMAGEQLRVTEGKEQGNRLSVDAGLMIGRAAPDEDGRLGGDPEISAPHARISREAGGQLTIEDLGSANGTFVNDERIDAPRALELGDVIRDGQDDASGARPLRAGAGEDAGLDGGSGC